MDNPPLDLQAEIARIDLAQAETRKFAAEQRKLSVEAEKMTKEMWWFPWLQLLTVAASSAAIAAVIAKLIH